MEKVEIYRCCKYTGQHDLVYYSDGTYTCTGWSKDENGEIKYSLWKLKGKYHYVSHNKGKIWDCCKNGHRDKEIVDALTYKLYELKFHEQLESKLEGSLGLPAKQSAPQGVVFE